MLFYKSFLTTLGIVDKWELSTKLSTIKGNRAVTRIGNIPTTTPHISPHPLLVLSCFRPHTNQPISSLFYSHICICIPIVPHETFLHSPIPISPWNPLLLSMFHMKHNTSHSYYLNFIYNSIYIYISHIITIYLIILYFFLIVSQFPYLIILSYNSIFLFYYFIFIYYTIPTSLLFF